MTSQKEQIQTLIAEIDGVLQRTNPRLPWVMSGEVTQQRQVLERVRNYLVALHQGGLSEPPGFGAAWAEGFSGGGYLSANEPTSRPDPVPSSQTENPAERSSQQMLQAILQEMSYVRANLPQAATNQQQVTAELLQVLMSRLQDNLSQQIAQTLSTLGNPSLPPGGNLALSSRGTSGGLAPSQFDQWTAGRSRSDQMLVNLDSTLNIVFESLQRNIQTYQESLSQSLERMHNLGQQGEATFKALIEQFTQQLKQEIAAQLLSSVQATAAVEPTAPPTPTPAAIAPPATPPRSRPESTVAVPHPFPYAGSEILASEISETEVASPPASSDRAAAFTPLDTAIESWLSSISTLNLDAQPAESLEAEADAFDLPALDLSQVELADFVPTPPSAPPTPEPTTATAAIAPEPTAKSPFAPTSEGADNEAQLLAELDTETADIDAALKLLEELSAELEQSIDELSVTEAEAQLNQILSAAPPIAETPEVAAISDDAREEVDEFYQDEFYQSLFGGPEATTEPEPSPTVASAPSASQPIARPEEPGGPASSTQAEPLAESPVSGSDLDAIAIDIPLDELFPETTTDLGGLNIEEAIANVTADMATEPDETGLPTLDLPDLSKGAAAANSDDLEVSPLLLELPEDLFSSEAPKNPTSEEVVSSEEADILASLEELETAPFALDSVGSLTDLFDEVKAEETQSVPTPPPGWSEIGMVSPNNLAEVEKFFTPNELFQDESTLDAAAAMELAEEQYVRAAPDENLLPDAPVDEIDLTVELDDFTLNSLNEDLSRLEESSLASDFNLQDLTIGELDRDRTTEFTLDELSTDIASSTPATERSPSPSPTFPEAPPQETWLDLGSLADNLGSDLQDSEPIESTEPQQTAGFDGSDSLADFAAGFAEPTPAIPATAPFYQASAEIGDLTIEALGDAFPDAPVSPSPTAADAPPVAPPTSIDQPPFLLEETTQFLGDEPTTPTAETTTAFTLEGMYDLFGDAPSIHPSAGGDRAPVEPSMPPPQSAFEEATPFTLEGMGDIFGEAQPQTAPSHPVPAAEPSPAQPPMDGIGQLFAQAQASSWAENPISDKSREIPPFRPDLFLSEEPGDLPPFHLEQLENLFVETAPARPEPSPPPQTPGARSPQMPLEQETLDTAFESIMGPSSPSPEPNAQPPFSQKKKRLI